MLSAADLRYHVITIQDKVMDKDEDGNDIVLWVTLYDDIPAGNKPLSVRQFMDAKATQSKIRGRFIIRKCPGLKAEQRIIDKVNGLIYDVEGWLPDPESGVEYVTAPYGEGVNWGGF